MRVTFLTEGGKNVGFGHLTRSLALSQAINNTNPDFDIEFVVYGDSNADDLLASYSVQYVIKKWWANNISEIMNEKDHYAIVDSYLAPKNVYDKISEITNGNILMIDDYKRMNYPPGIVVNPSVYGEKMEYPENKNIRYLLGSDYVILRKEFWNISDKEIRNSIEKIMLTFGGVGHQDFAKNVIRMLEKEYEVLYVDAQQNRLTASEMIDTMLEADVCISAGGQTTYELARIGIPTIGICFADNQINNLKGWSEKGFLKYIGWYHEKGIKKRLTAAMEDIKSQQEREKRKNTGRNIVDGLGGVRIAEYVHKKYEF